VQPDREDRELIVGKLVIAHGLCHDGGRRSLVGQTGS
jgi:hypothetical protein